MTKIIENDFTGGQGAMPQQPQINPADLPYIECESCGHQVFEEKMMIKKVSKLLTGNPTDSIMPVPVIACSKCGHVNELFMPKV